MSLSLSQASNLHVKCPGQQMQDKVHLYSKQCYSLYIVCTACMQTMGFLPLVKAKQRSKCSIQNVRAWQDESIEIVNKFVCCFSKNNFRTSERTQIQIMLITIHSCDTLVLEPLLCESRTRITFIFICTSFFNNCLAPTNNIMCMCVHMWE